MKKIYFILFALFSVFAFSQTLGSRLEKKTLALGEVGLFRINISDLQGKDVISAPKNELLPFHFEEIKDSINKRPEFYERVIEFAIFEEGNPCGIKAVLNNKGICEPFTRLPLVPASEKLTSKINQLLTEI